MLIDYNLILNELKKVNVVPSGAFHIGAHECEEMGFYNNTLNIPKDDIIWIDAISEKVNQMKEKGIPNIYQAVITDKDNDIVEFKVSNNVQSSSIFNFKTHSIEHPWVKYVSKFQAKTITIDTFFKENNIDPEKYNFWNFDIQGAELLALKGSSNSIKYANAIYLEVNEKELYEGCGLIKEVDGFLQEKGFTRVLTNMTSHGWGDGLYIRNNIN
jgi:FkbM family methyltransferase